MPLPSAQHQQNSEEALTDELVEFFASLKSPTIIGDLPELPPDALRPTVVPEPPPPISSRKSNDDTLNEDGEEDDFYGDRKQVRSMKSVSKALRDMGVDVTWTSFHRYCMDQALSSPQHLKGLMTEFGIDKEQLHKIIITYVPEVLTERLCSELRRWHKNEGTSRTASTHHFFESFRNVGDKNDTYWFVRERLLKLGEEIRQAHGHPDNITYLRGVYKNALCAFSGVLPHNFKPAAWMRAVNASHDVTVKAVPRAAFLYVSRKVATEHGDKYDNERMETKFREESDLAARSIFHALRLGGSAVTESDDQFATLDHDFRLRLMTRKDFVTKAVQSTTDTMSRRCNSAFHDTISHVKVMDEPFCRYFKEHFGADIWTKRFEIAKTYAKL